MRALRLPSALMKPETHHFHSTAHEVLANIARVELPDADLVLGAEGPLVDLWAG